MDEELKNKVINSIEDMYFKEFKDEYTGFLGGMCLNLLDNILNCYRKFITAYPKANNQQMNEPIDSSLPIDKYFERIDDFIQYANARNTPYKLAQVIQKAHHKVLVSGIYVDAYKEWKRILQTNKQTWIGLNIFLRMNNTTSI